MSDERKGTAAAQLFYEKGYENTYLLNGGIEQFVEEFTSLCEGKSIPITKSHIKCKNLLYREILIAFLEIKKTRKRLKRSKKRSKSTMLAYKNINNIE